MRQTFKIFVSFLLLFASASVRAQSECPPFTPGNPTCYSGVDANGAHYLIAMPKDYNGQLALWNHGYTLSPPGPLTDVTDLGFPVVLLVEGFAVAASSYRPNALGMGGWAVADAAADTDHLRLRFIEMFGKPAATYVVGGSEGGIVTAKIVEELGVAADGSFNYNGSLPMCGPLAGGRRNFYGAFDIRVVYQYYCRNVPRPDEPQYELYLGLAPGDTMTSGELASRINECTGILLPPEERSPTQAQNLANILGVTGIPESFLLTDMGYATFAMQELVQVRAGGRSPVTNLGVIYTGSMDDEALNAGVYRAGSHPEGLAYIRTAYDPTGNVQMPTITMHTVGDGLVIVENEQAYRVTLEDAGRADNLFQTYSSPINDGHCMFSLAEFEAALHALLGWVQTGEPPTHQGIAELCEFFSQKVGGECNFNPDYDPQPFESRVRPRDP
jgi:hypothetical protein